MINGLNIANERQKLPDLVLKDPAICCLQETHFKYKHVDGLKNFNGKSHTTQTEIKRKLSGYINISQSEVQNMNITRDKEIH